MYEDSILERVVSIINNICLVPPVSVDEKVFSKKSGILATDMIYILFAVSKEFGIEITEDFVDKLENCTISQFADLVEVYSG